MSKDWQKKALELREEGYSNRAIGRKLGKDESVIRRYFKRLAEQVEIFGEPLDIPVESHWDKFNPHPAQQKMLDEEPKVLFYGGASIQKAWPMKIKPLQPEVAPTTGAKVLFLDLEVTASVVAAFSMFKHFSTPDHIIQFPYILSFACNWLHEPEDKIYAVHLADFEGFEEDHKSDKELVMRLWQFFEEADIIVIQNEGFDRGWFSQRCAYWDLPEPAPYRVCCTLKGLKKAMSLPSNSLGYSTKYFNLGHQKLSHDGISLWIRCMNGEVEALDLMKEYNIGDIPTLRQLYLKIRPWIPNHPNVALYYGDKDGRKRCSVCGSTHLMELESKAYTNLSIFTAYRCNDCGTVKRDGEREKGSSKHYLRTISK
jgi:transposase-like protein